jgi:pilus assembly protein CpaB
MKNLKAIGLIALALLIGLGAAAYAAGWVAQKRGGATTGVVVAATDIELGSKIGAQMLNAVDWPSDAVPPGSFKTVRDVQDRVAKVGIVRGEAVMERKLAPVGTQGGLSAVIAEGKRAMTVRVNDVVGVAGFALPGNFVDVMVNARRDGDGDGREISKTVLEHVLVLAIAQEASRDDTKPKVVSAVTLELTPADSEKLDLARSVGTLSLVLRNQIDASAVPTNGVTKGELFDGQKPAAVKVAAVRPVRQIVRHTPVQRQDCVEVIQNGMRNFACF